MKDRIKKIRKEFGLTQQEFAKRIGTSQNVLANYETGRRNPSSSVINNICKTFGVNEVWLRTGEGEIFSLNPNEMQYVQVTKENVLGNDSLTVEAMRLYLDLPPAAKKKASDYIRNLADASKSDQPDK